MLLGFLALTFSNVFLHVFIILVRVYVGEVYLWDLCCGSYFGHMYIHIYVFLYAYIYMIYNIDRSEFFFFFLIDLFILIGG